MGRFKPYSGFVVSRSNENSLSIKCRLIHHLREVTKMMEIEFRVSLRVSLRVSVYCATKTKCVR